MNTETDHDKRGATGIQSTDAFMLSNLEDQLQRIRRSDGSAGLQELDPSFGIFKWILNVSVSVLESRFNMLLI
jgi:hypothetical protein